MNLPRLCKQAPLYLLLLGSFFLPFYGTSQGGPAPPGILEGHPAPQAYVRPDNLLWMKTTWERIDLRKKLNQPMYFPLQPTQGRNSLFGYILDAVLEEQLFPVYDVGLMGDDDMFTKRLTRNELLKALSDTQLVETTSILDGSSMLVPVVDNVETRDIIAYDIKERWYIDAERSVMDVTIVGISPVMAVYDPETGDYRGTKNLFWINFEEARQAMAKWAVYDPHNDLQYMTYDDLFLARKFEGTFTKVSNVYDRSFVEYLGPLDALTEAQLQREKIRNTELDMWQY